MKVLIFGGTTEGHRLSKALSAAGIDVTLSVATEFGRKTAESNLSAADNGMMIVADRLGEKDIIDLLKQSAYDYIVDATHPYAVLATHNIRASCESAGLKYYRLKRPESAKIPGITYVPNANAAADIVKKGDKKVLLTIGSKELEPFTQADNFAQRFHIRILPMRDSLTKALDLGFLGANIICMQGPFDREMNTATLKKTCAKYLITKDSGDIGGFEAKVSAAFSLGCEVIVISRPIEKEGYTLSELLEIFNLFQF